MSRLPSRPAEVKAFAVQADLSSESEVERVFGAVTDRLGSLDVLVANCGGLLKRDRVIDCSLELWNEAIAVNLTSTFL